MALTPEESTFLETIHKTGLPEPRSAVEWYVIHERCRTLIPKLLTALEEAGEREKILREGLEQIINSVDPISKANNIAVNALWRANQVGVVTND